MSYPVEFCLYSLFKDFRVLLLFYYDVFQLSLHCLTIDEQQVELYLDYLPQYDVKSIKSNPGQHIKDMHYH